ncbi:hypothetical protein SeLEV6574_g02396 [Synchytrium endobioticum]|uniref:MHD domain-containing protein n=1 Tax=Synchytrium endobioticum TaxID=286115 RepID=A0A507D8G1_9FUNG|nr:hypothetical protein SeLEV6574_g02396 [Synchytrium endobioticum]
MQRELPWSTLTFPEIIEQFKKWTSMMKESFSRLSDMMDRQESITEIFTQRLNNFKQELVQDVNSTIFFWCTVYALMSAGAFWLFTHNRSCRLENLLREHNELLKRQNQLLERQNQLVTGTKTLEGTDSDSAIKCLGNANDGSSSRDTRIDRAVRTLGRRPNRKLEVASRKFQGRRMRFVESFSFEKPRESVEILLKRLRKGRAIEEEVAEYFRERAQIEERYADELRRLSKKQPTTDKEHFGTFAPVWEQVLLATAEVATLHSSLAHFLSDKIDKPLRTRGETDPDWSKLRLYENDFVKRTREYEDKVQKAAKLDGKKRPAGSGFMASRAEKRLNEATTGAEQARIQWNNEAVQLFDKFQRMEDNRLNLLKRYMTEYATFDAQNAQARALVPDKTLAMAVSFDVENEIDQFCAIKGNINKSGSVPSVTALGGSSRSASFSQRSTSGQQSINGQQSTNREMSINGVETTNGQQTINGQQITTPALTVPMTRPADADAVAANDLASPHVDGEGYTIRPQSMGNNTWAFETASNVGDDDDTASISSQPRFNFNIKKDAIIEEDGFNTMRVMAANLRNTTQSTKGTRRGDERPGSIAGLSSASSEPTPLDELFGNAMQEGNESSPPVPPFKAVIKETINALLRNGSVDRLLLVGDISIVLPQTVPPPRGTVVLRLINASSLEKAVPNTTYLRALDTMPGDYVLSLDALRAALGKEVPIIKYQVKANAWGGDSLIPFIMIPFWKVELGSTSLVVAYRHNSKTGIAGITLKDVQVVVNIDGPPELAFGDVQTKPPGIFSADRKALLWKLGDVTPSLTHDSTDGEAPTEKLVAKFETPGGIAAGGSIAARFTAEGSILSDIGLEFVPDARFEVSRASIGEFVRKIVAGKYGAAG